MEEKPRSVTVHTLYYGLITGAVLIVYSLLLYIFDQLMNRSLGWISLILLLAGIFYSTYTYKKSYMNGFMTYGQAFKSCFLTGIFAGVLNAIYTFILYNFIDPGLVQQMIDTARDQMIAGNPNMSDVDIERGIAWIEKFTGPVTSTITGLVMMVFFSAIIALILAIFLKKEDPALQNTY